MTTSKISELGASSTLDGSEVLPVVKAGATVKATVAQVLAGAATPAQGALAGTAVQPGALGGAATLNVGTTAGTVAAGDAAPKAHAATHSPGGTDPLAGTTAGADEMRSLTGLSVATVRKWRKALASARTGVTRAHIACIGDSLTEGSNVSVPRPEYIYAWPNLLAQMIDTWVGTPSNDTGFIAPNLWILASPLETRFTITGTTWGYYGGGPFGKGRQVKNTDSMTFTPGRSVDRFRIWYRTGAFGGTASWSVDSGATSGTFSCAGSTGLAYVDCPAGTTGAHTLTITAPAGASSTMFLNGVEAMIGTTGGVKVSRFGYNGGQTSDCVSGGSNIDGSMASISNSAPDITIIMIGTNDYTAQIPLATYNANVTALATNALTTGSCLLVIEPLQSAGYTIPQTSYNAETRAVGATLGVPVLDLSDRWGSWATANALGVMADGVHPNQIGSMEMTSAVFSAIQRMS